MTATENKPESKKDKINDGAILEALYKQVDRVELTFGNLLVIHSFLSWAR
jgi:hypothetical protein